MALRKEDVERRTVFKSLIKRDGRETPFDSSKITEAIFKAAKAIGQENRMMAMELTLDVLNLMQGNYSGEIFTVEQVQDFVEKTLIEQNYPDIAKAYILHRAKRTRLREAKGDLMDAVEEILEEPDRENANISNSPSAKMLKIASAASKKYYLSRLIPEDMSHAHACGDIHIHDLDFYGKTLTCIQIPLGRLLKEGFNTGHGYIRAPKRPTSATALAAIILQSSQNDMHGGQSFAFFDRDIAPFVEDADDNETYQAMEALIYNLNSMHSRAGAQVPFSSLNLGTETSEAARRVTRNLLLAYEVGLGRGENPIFPNIIFRVRDGVNLKPEDPNYDLLQLAIRVSSKRLNPTFSFMDSSFNNKFGDQVGYMGCRTRVMANRKGTAVTDGRGNLSFTTINLPRLAIRAKGSLSTFYRLLNHTFDLVARQLYHRFKVQANLKVRDMPFVMGQGLYLDSGGLKPDDSIEEVIKHGTLSPGFVGLAEALVALTGKHHGEDTSSQELGLEILTYLRWMCDQASEEYDLNYTLLATPAESVSGRFAKLDQGEFGIIPGVTDKGYYTNSFHVPVGYPISIFDKISLEGPYHKFANAGHISYIEMASPPTHNSQAMEAIIKHMIASDMGYAAINFPVDYCMSCGFTSVIKEDHCPRCEMPEIKRVRRITGYLSTSDRFGPSKVAELNDRVVHS